MTNSATFNAISTDNIMTLASELYAWNCKQDKEFTLLSAADIFSCICVDAEDKLGRKPTDSEEDSIKEALQLFGVNT